MYYNKHHERRFIMNDLDVIVDTYLRGNISSIGFLMYTVPNINEFTNDGETLLTWACARCSTTFVEIILRNNLIDINKKNLWGFSPLSIACVNNSTEIVKLLLDKNANVNVLDHNEDTPIMIAYKNNALDIMQLLLDHNARIYIDSFESIASNDNLLSTMNTLSVSLQSSYGFNLMHKACMDNNVAVIDLLLHKYGDKYVHECDENMLYPIHYACMNESLSAACKLIQHGANLNVYSYKKFYPIEFACMTKCYPMVKLLIDHGAYINVFDEFSNTPLIYTCIDGCLDLVNLLIANNVDVNLPNSSGFTPLIHACRCGNSNLAKILIHAGANVNKVTNLGFNALHFALQNNNTYMAELLIAHDSDISFMARNNGSQLVKDLLNSYNTKVSTIVALHLFDVVRLKNNLCLYNKRHGTSATANFIKQIKSSEDYKCCQKLNNLYKRHLTKLIESKNNIESNIKSSHNILRKMSYAKDKEICLNQISLTQKKLHNIRDLLRTIDNFTYTREDLPQKISHKRIII